MCGITGILPADAKLEHNIKHDILAMTESLRHRGPNNLSYYTDKNIALGHTRLSILDLSSIATQPKKSFSGRFIISFNGEIYNHLELRNEIEREYGFKNWESKSDTLTLVNMFEFWDAEKILNKIKGMFAFALWDKKLKKLVLARDRFGEKPLYFGWIEKDFVFGSELKAIKKHPKFMNSISDKALSLYTQVHYVPSPLSIYKDIYKLEPANIIIISNEHEKINLEKKNIEVQKKGFLKKKWWNHRDKPDFYDLRAKLNYKEKIEFLDQTISTSVKRQLISDVPIGSFLSGGLDSTLMTLMMTRNTSQQVNTFTIGMENHFYDESRRAAKISKQLGTNHHQILVSDKDVIDVLPKINDMYDEPFADSSQIPTYLLCNFASKSVTVAISGDGGDEVFSGYIRHIWSEKIIKIIKFAPNYLKKKIGKYLLNLDYKSVEKFEKLLNFFISSQSRLVQLDKKFNKLGSVLLSNSLNKFYLSLISTWPNSLNTRLAFENFNFSNDENLITEKDVPLMDIDNYLHDDVLCKVDRASMASSLEVRVPFLDKDIFDASQIFSFREKVQGSIGKKPIRDILMKYLPKELVNQPKMGFGIPLNNWLRTSLKNWVEDILYSQSSKEQDYIDLDKVIMYWKLHKSGGNNYGEFLWNSLILLNWLRVNAKQ